jgi:hypothetical protein
MLNATSLISSDTTVVLSPEPAGVTPGVTVGIIAGVSSDVSDLQPVTASKRLAANPRAAIIEQLLFVFFI